MDALTLPAGYRLERGMLWPADDRACAAVVFETAADLYLAVRHCRGSSLAVQAGGNMGVWALDLAAKFDRVVTFEPDPANFRALVHNTASAGNILALPCALGDKPGWCDLDRQEHNAGAHQVASGSVAPVVALDSLQLPACDLLYLDIEGYEMPALIGAVDTIRRFKPVIAIEDKGLSKRYGYQQGDAERFLASHGYRVAARPNRDVLLVCE